ncbi:ABC-three component system middle component 6 [Vibrio cholerae]|uniref:ABC-three component system middle component 6 n=1 Tax=Vibrio metoecus TaxID=1481663 RepID=UPI0012AE4474|nr:ABC-three component system middle component 6 [Vibrio metoecus]
MIISKNINPDKDLYVIGAHIIDVLKSTKGKSIDYFELYQKLKNHIDVSMQLFSLSVSWLFLLGVIDKNGEGRITKCF